MFDEGPDVVAPKHQYFQGATRKAGCRRGGLKDNSQQRNAAKSRNKKRAIGHNRVAKKVRPSKEGS